MMAMYWLRFCRMRLNLRRWQQSGKWHWITLPRIQRQQTNSKWDYRADAGTGCQISGDFRRKEKSSFRKAKEKSLANVPAVELMSGRKSKLYCSDRNCALPYGRTINSCKPGKKMDKAAAKKFLSKRKIHYKDLVSRKTGDSVVTVRWFDRWGNAVQSEFPATISSVLQAIKDCLFNTNIMKEDLSMKEKGNFRKVVSGCWQAWQCLAIESVISDDCTYAEISQRKPPLYEEVKDLLDEDEVVTAKDYEIETGSVFDVKSDYTGLEIRMITKVKSHWGSKERKEWGFWRSCGYLQSDYYVEPVNQEHPKYQISRKLIRESNRSSTGGRSEAVTESGNSWQWTADERSGGFRSRIGDYRYWRLTSLMIYGRAGTESGYLMKNQGLKLHNVLEQAGDEGVDLDSMEGEIATFEAVSAYSARSTQQVTIEKGPLYRYADYNLEPIWQSRTIATEASGLNCVLCTAGKTWTRIWKL